MLKYYLCQTAKMIGFTFCYALLDDNVDNKVYFENNNIKAFHHAIFISLWILRQRLIDAKNPKN